jgi:large repetitive protein
MQGSLSLIRYSCILFILSSSQLNAQFLTSELSGYTVSNGTSLQFGPDGRLYVTQQNGVIKVFTVQRNAANNYQVVKTEVINLINQIANHNDDGSVSSTQGRQVTGIWVEGTAAKPVIYTSSSDPRIGGPSGDKNLDTNSGIITRLTWKAATTPANTDFNAQPDTDRWDKVDLVRGLPRSEENHATNGLQVHTVNGKRYLFICSGGNTNAGGPSRNFTKITEFALASAILSVDLSVLEVMPVLGSSTNKYVYDLPTVDDPSRNNANGITNPATPGYNGIDINDPFGGNDGLNQAKIVQGGPVQIFSPGYRNTYDLVITKAGRMYVSDNGANGGWGGVPENEGPEVNGQSLVTNNYHYILSNGNALEPGSDVPYNGQTVNNKDNLHLVTGLGTNTVSNYTWGSYYAGHPVPIRANPSGAGLYTHDGENTDFNGYFRTSYTGNPSTSLPYDWPPVPVSMADPRQGDFRNPGTNMAIGEDGALLTWSNNTNPLTEYKASNLNGAYQGNLFAGHSGGYLHRVELNANGSLNKLTQNFASPGGTILGLTAQDDNEIFPGTIWMATHGGQIKIMEPQDYDGGGGTICLQPGQAGYIAAADYDNDGYSNQDEIDNGTDHCASSIFPPDFDGDFISDLNDPDDDNDGIPDHLDPFQMGVPFDLPVKNELFSDKMPGFRGLGLTGLMTNLDPNDNYLNWMDKPGDGDGVDDIYGGAVGAITVYMTAGTAYGSTNTQEKAFQFGVNMDQSKGPVTVRSRMLPPFHAHTAGQSQGIYIGNGDQDNYLAVNLVTNGYEVVKEVGGVPQKTTYTLARASTLLDIFFLIDPVGGTIQPKIAINGATPVALGTPLPMTGALLAAIQQSGTPMAVGLMGTNAGQAEFAVNVDYFFVEGAAPYSTNLFEPINLTIGGAGKSLELTDYFDDDNGHTQLTFSISQNTFNNLNPFISGTTLTIPAPNQSGSGILTIRATDVDNNFVEQNLSVSVLEAATVLFRVNAGGPAITALDAGKPNWSSDTNTSPSPYRNTGSAATFEGVTLHQSVDPAIVPTSMFITERWDGATAPEMLWTFPVEQPGTYEVRLYFRNGYSGTTAPGSRVFSILIEGQPISALTNIDLSGTYGHQVGVMLKAQVQSDANLQIEFIHGVENPLVNGIEVLRVSGTPVNTPPSIVAIPNQTHQEGDQPDLVVVASDPEDNLTYSISGQPTGLSIEPTNGHITGIITAGAAANSPYTVTVSVSDQVNPPVTTSFTWIVNAALTLTTNVSGSGSISKSPNKTSYTAGESVQLTATPAAGWQFTGWSGSVTGTTNPLTLIMDGSKSVTATFIQLPTETIVLFRVNAGGPAITALDAGKPNWSSDTNASPSPYRNTGSAATFEGVTLHQSVDPAIVPTSMFITERWDGATAPEMLWTFPVEQPGTYEVRLYFRNGYSGTTAPGSRVFSILIEGQPISALTNIDLSGTYGHQVGVMLKAQVQSDANLQIEFIHGVENPLVNGIEILRVSGTPVNTPPSIVAIPNQTHQEGDQPDLAAVAFDLEDNLVYGISGQPAGLSIEPTNGHITGIISTGAAANSPYTVTVTASDQVNPPASTTFTWTINPATSNGTGQWVTLHTGTCTLPTSSTTGTCPQGRHENGYVQVGDKFYLIGGRENSSNVNMYDPNTKQWSIRANAPMSMHHFQAVAYDGLIYVIGALSGGYPGEQPVPNVYLYNPLSNQWLQGPEIPRKRGASAAVLHNGKIYIVSGQTSGHAGGHVAWVDEFNPVTNTWRQLADIPNSRDHIHAVVVNNKMYIMSGRKSDYQSPAGVQGNTIAQVDVFDFATETWTTLPSSANIPTLRAGASVTYLSNEILVLGGESTSSSTLPKAEAFDPNTQTWRTIAPMLTGRHATQAIVNNGVVYLAGGSPNTGGGTSFAQEAFFFTTQNAPQLPTISQSNLSGPAEVDFGAVANSTTANTTFTITNSGSSQAIQISSINVTGTGFQVSMPAGHTLPVLIKPGASLVLTGTYQSNGTPNATGQVTVNHSGQNAAVSIALKANTGSATTYVLTTNASGSGTIARTPDKPSYNSGETVQLTATPATGWQFSNWSGSASGSTNPLTVTMDGNKTITATFTQLPTGGQQVVSYTLINSQTNTDIMTITNGSTLNIAGLNGVNIRANTSPAIVGSVVMNLSGATTNNRTESTAPYAQFGDSNGNYSNGTLNLGNHTLTATPYTSSGGNGTAGTPLTVNFTVVNQSASSYTLNVGITGSGSVIKNPDQSTYTPGQSVQLTANAASGWLFDRWEGSLTGNTNPATIVMNNNASITAIFIQQTVSYSLTTSVTGSGSVSRSPNQQSFTSGQSVQLTASPASGWQFSNWSGNATGSVNPLTIVMDGNKTITANFTQLPTDGQQVISFTLINSQTNADVMTITNGSTINIFGLSGVNIRANTSPATVGSVVMSLTGATSVNRTEGAAPYALWGDINSNYSNGSMNLGSHTLTSTPYTQTGGNGTAGTPLTVNFTVVNNSSSRVGAESAPTPEVTDGRELFIYPNPFKDAIFVKVDAVANTTISLQMVDPTGRTVGNHQIVIRHPEEVNEISTEHLPAGIYLIRAFGMDGSLWKNVRIVKH